MTRLPFQKDTACPKCGNDWLMNSYHADGDGEYLQFRCPSCGYEWQTQTADAQPQPAHTCGECAHLTRINDPNLVPATLRGCNDMGRYTEDDRPACSAFTPHDPALLPCPFCGKEPTIDGEATPNCYVFLVRCDNAQCPVRPITDTCGSKNDAIAAWNTRTP